MTSTVKVNLNPFVIRRTLRTERHGDKLFMFNEIFEWTIGLN